MIETLAFLLVLAMVPFATLNPVLYAYVHNWRRSREGRALMTLWVSLAALVDLSVLYRLVPAFPAKPYVALFVYAGILASMVRFSVILLRELLKQRRARNS